MRRPGPAAVAGQTPAPPPRGAKRPALLWAGIAAVVVAAVVGGGIFFATSPGSDPRQAPSAEPDAADAPADAVGDDDLEVPLVTGLAGTVSATGVTFAWTNPAPQPGDVYLWGVSHAGAETTLASAEATTVNIPADPSGTTCIEVSIRRADGRSSAEPARGCAP